MNSEELEQALALHYNGKDAPTVVASGQGELADQIIKMAREHDVPVLENRELLSMMATLDIGQTIPEQLFGVIAEIIALSYWMRGKVPEGWEQPAGKPASGRDLILPEQDDQL